MYKPVRYIMDTDSNNIMYNLPMFYPAQVDLQASTSRCAPSPLGGTNSARDSYARLIRQPTSKTTKFRYESEERVTGATYIIEILNYTGVAEIYVSCVTAEEPYKAHPYKVTGENITRKNGAGRISINISPYKNQVKFSKLGVQCVKKQNIDGSLTERSNLRKAGDPFNQKFTHLKEPVDLKAARLCFEVFILNPSTGKCDTRLKPVLSEVISSKPELKICHVSHCFSLIGEERDVTIFCDKVEKDDITVQFFHDKVWKADAAIKYVHRGFGIVFTVPQYPHFITETVECYFQLFRPSDKKTSEPCKFEFHPKALRQTGKRRKTIEDLSSVFEELELRLKSPSNSVPTHRDFGNLVKAVPTTSQQTERNNAQLMTEIGLEVDSGELKVAENMFLDNCSDTPLPILTYVNLDA